MTTPKPKPQFSDELIDQLLADYKTPEDLTGKDGILKQLTARLVERALQAEMSDHLGYNKHEAKGRGSGNSRNGTGTKTLKTDVGAVEIEVPRDREGTFEPQLVKKRQTRFKGFDEKIVALYARGMTVRDIQSHLEELYGVEVSPDLISRATSAVMEDVLAWQGRPLDPSTSTWPWPSPCTGPRRSWGCGSSRTRGQILAEGDQRAQDARGPGHPGRLLRRAQGLP